MTKETYHEAELLCRQIENVTGTVTFIEEIADNVKCDPESRMCGISLVTNRGSQTLTEGEAVIISHALKEYIKSLEQQFEKL